MSKVGKWFKWTVGNSSGYKIRNDNKRDFCPLWYGIAEQCLPICLEKC